MQLCKFSWIYPKIATKYSYRTDDPIANAYSDAGKVILSSVVHNTNGPEPLASCVYLPLPFVQLVTEMLERDDRWLETLRPALIAAVSKEEVDELEVVDIVFDALDNLYDTKVYFQRALEPLHKDAFAVLESSGYWGPLRPEAETRLPSREAELWEEE
jgi:hypothetical protein